MAHILLVSAKPESPDMIADMALGKAGHRVTSCGTHEAIVRHLSTIGCDLILFNGTYTLDKGLWSDVMKQLRANGVKKPMIYSSSYKPSTVSSVTGIGTAELEELGVTWVPKGFPNELTSTIAELLEG